MPRRVSASARLRKRSPTSGARPPGRYAARVAGSTESFSICRPQSQATRGVTRMPSSARRIAGARTSESGFDPWSRVSVNHAEIAPGIVTAWTGVGGISRMSRSTYHSAFAAPGARPEPSSAMGAAPALERERGAAAHRDQCEAAAAYAGHVRLDNGQYGDGGERRVDRVAAGSQHIEAGHGGSRMRRADHAVLANRHRSALFRE